MMTWQKRRFVLKWQMQKTRGLLVSGAVICSTSQLRTLLLLSYKYCVYVRCRNDSIIRDYYLLHERKPLPHDLLCFGHYLKKLFVV